MSAGTLKKRVIIQREVQINDVAGGYAISWQDVAEVWARVKPMRGTESLEAMQMRDVQMYEVTIRYRSDVTPKHRIAWGSRLFNIRSVMNKDERNKYLTMMCEEGIGT